MAVLALLACAGTVSLLQLIEYQRQHDADERERMLRWQREDFTAALAHDVRIPILADKRIFEALLNGTLGDTSEAQKSVFRALLKTNDEQLDHIGQFLDVYQYQNRRHERPSYEIDVADICREAFEAFSDRATAAGVQLKAPLQLPPYSVTGMPSSH